MARSTFEGPILAGDNRFGPQRDVGYAKLIQQAFLDFAVTTPNTAITLVVLKYLLTLTTFQITQQLFGLHKMVFIATVVLQLELLQLLTFLALFTVVLFS